VVKGGKFMFSNKKGLPKFIAAALIVTLTINIVMYFISQSNYQQIGYNEFLTMLDNKQIQSVEIDSDRLIITPKGDSNASVLDKKLYYTGYLYDPHIVDKLYNAGVKFSTPVKNTQSPLINFLLSWILPFVMFYLFSTLLMRSLGKKMGGGGVMSFGKSNAKVYVEKTTGVLLMM
jgi:cell division protease FtsH